MQLRRNDDNYCTCTVIHIYYYLELGDKNLQDRTKMDKSFSGVNTIPLLTIHCVCVR